MNFNDLLDIEFLEFDDDYAKAKIPLKEEFANNIHSLHGGIIASIADTVSGYIASSVKIMTPTNNMSIYFLNPIMVEAGQYVYAEANVIKRGKKIIVVDCKIYDNDYNLAATVTSSYSTAKRRISPEVINEVTDYISIEKEKN